MPLDDIRDEMNGDAGFENGDESGLDGFSGGGGGARRFGGGAIVMILLVAGSIGGLYSMRALGTSNALPGGDQGLESTIELGLKRIGESGPISLEGAADLMPDFSGRQVPAESMSINPFRSITEPAPVTIVEVEEGDEIDPAAIAGAIALAGESEFKVSSIMAGRENIALINGQIVRKGDRLEALTPYGPVQFEVAEIVREAVRLRAEHPELEAPVVVTLTVLATG